MFCFLKAALLPGQTTFNTSITLTALPVLLFASRLASASADAPANPYAGQEARAIKALSEQDVASLLAGKGAALAKAAELNGYPGPAHVLELAEPLHLNAVQVEATRQLMTAHNGRARQLGAELVASERELDALFARGQASPLLVDQATQRVGMLQARLRAEHLTTHLTQTALLSAEQARQYGVLRGYAKPTADPATKPEMDHTPGSVHHH